MRYIFTEKYNIYVPIHLVNHWTGIEINQNDKKLTYFDSFKKKNKSCFDLILLYLYNKEKEYFPTEKTLEEFKKEWKCEYLHKTCLNMPYQTNAWDCGVFFLLYGSYIAEKEIFDFEQEDMGEAKLSIAYNILKRRYW